MTTQIKLQFPIEFNGVTVSELTMRRAKVKDRRLAEKAGASDADKEIALVANLCEVAPAVIDELDAVDYLQLQKALTSFFGSATGS